MGLPKRGEKGFTLIELLIVIAILGVLAAVVIPNVGRFMGAGQEESAKTELSNVQVAVTSMMVDNNLSALPAGTFVTAASPTKQMYSFPAPNATIVTIKKNDPNGTPYQGLDKGGYLLYDHDLLANNSPVELVRYVASANTTGSYYVDADGTVYQALTGYE